MWLFDVCYYNLNKVVSILGVSSDYDVCTCVTEVFVIYTDAVASGFLASLHVWLTVAYEHHPGTGCVYAFLLEVTLDHLCLITGSTIVVCRAVADYSVEVLRHTHVFKEPVGVLLFVCSHGTHAHTWEFLT